MTDAPFTTNAAHWTADDFRRLAGRVLHPAPQMAPPRSNDGLAPSDFDLNPDAVSEHWKGGGGTPAAVLVPVVARDPLSLILTLRTGHLSSHAGQIAFPGGKIDAADGGARAAALREAEEEIGLDRSFAEPLGYLDTYRTVTNFAVVPVVALVEPGFCLRLNHNEVAEAFEVPLSFLMDVGNHAMHTRVVGGRERHYYAMPYGERYIWGATAGILRNMHKRFFAP